ncbi:hypothetical protein WU83_27840, partial [Mycobacterium nebraskense]
DGAPRRGQKPGRPAEIVGNQRNVAQLQRIDDGGDGLARFGKRREWQPVAESATGCINNDAAKIVL